MATQADDLDQHRDIPRAVKQELMDCAVHNGRISYHWLCGLYRRGREDGKGASEGVILAAIDRLSGDVEGMPTQRVNFLQRIDELRRIEAEVTRLTQELKREECAHLATMKIIESRDHQCAELRQENERLTVGSAAQFQAGWDAGFQEALLPDEHPDQNRCAVAYAEYLQAVEPSTKGDTQ